MHADIKDKPIFIKVYTRNALLVIFIANASPFLICLFMSLSRTKTFPLYTHADLICRFHPPYCTLLPTKEKKQQILKETTCPDEVTGISIKAVQLYYLHMITRQKHNLVLPIVNNSYSPPLLRMVILCMRKVDFLAGKKPIN